MSLEYQRTVSRYFQTLVYALVGDLVGLAVGAFVGAIVGAVLKGENIGFKM